MGFIITGKAHVGCIRPLTNRRQSKLCPSKAVNFVGLQQHRDSTTKRPLIFFNKF